MHASLPGFPRTRHSGFSLVELLVVISILALLASMLMAAVGIVQRSARGAVCLSRVKSIGLAWADYENAWECQGPYAFHDGQDFGGGNREFWTWDFLLRQYADEGANTAASGQVFLKDINVGEWTKTYTCPADRIACRYPTFVRRSYSLNGAFAGGWDTMYGMVTYDAAQGVPGTANSYQSTLSRSRAASGSILLTENPHPDNYQGGDSYVMVGSPREQVDQQAGWGEGVSGLHGAERFSYLFVDLHAQILRWSATWPGEALATMNSLSSIPPRPWNVGAPVH